MKTKQLLIAVMLIFAGIVNAQTSQAPVIIGTDGFQTSGTVTTINIDVATMSDSARTGYELYAYDDVNFENMLGYSAKWNMPVAQSNNTRTYTIAINSEKNMHYRVRLFVENWNGSGEMWGEFNTTVATGITELQSNFKVTYNGALKAINVTSNVNGITTATVTNLIGQQVISQTIEAGTTVIDTKSVTAPGIYVLRLSNGSKTFTQKFVIN